MENQLDVFAFFLLAASVAALWAPVRQLWRFSFLLAVGLGLAAGRLDGFALVVIVLLGAACWQSQRGETPPRRFAGSLVVFGIGAALMLHAVPGFDGWLVAPDVRLSPGSLPFSLYLNFDKPLLGLLLLAASGSLLTTSEGWRRILPWTLGLLAAAMILVVAVTELLGYAAWDPKLPAFFALWAPRNLLFTLRTRPPRVTAL